MSQATDSIFTKNEFCKALGRKLVTEAIPDAAARGFVKAAFRKEHLRFPTVHEMGLALRERDSLLGVS